MRIILTFILLFSFAVQAQQRGRVTGQTVRNPNVPAYPIEGEAAVAAKAKFPEAAPRVGIMGTVQLECIVGVDGVVKFVKVTNPIGAGYDEAALEAIWTSRFAPAKQAGTNVQSKLRARVRFSLLEDKPTVYVSFTPRIERAVTGIVQEAPINDLSTPISILNAPLENQVHAGSTSNATTAPMVNIPPLPGGVLEVAEQMPEPVGGIGAMQSKIVYPIEAKKEGKHGRVVVVFIVDENGDVQNPQIVTQPVGGGCDEEALRVVQATKFVPGKNEGKAVKVRMSIPIRFNLN